MTCKEIIEKHLKDNGFDGLCNPDHECGCYLYTRNCFMVCGSDPSDCVPGFKGPDPDDEVDSLIYPTREAAEAAKKKAAEEEKKPDPGQEGWKPTAGYQPK